MKPTAYVTIKWRSPEQGGRRTPFTGSLYAATAKVAEQSDELFSVVLDLSKVEMSSLRNLILSREKVRRRKNLQDQKKEIILARFPENAGVTLKIGQKLLITEGPRTVAECVILDVIGSKHNNIRIQSPKGTRRVATSIGTKNRKKESDTSTRLCIYSNRQGG